jgi:DNA processing protein
LIIFVPRIKLHFLLLTTHILPHTEYVLNVSFIFMTETEKTYRIAISLFKKINFSNLQYIFNYLDSVEEFFHLDETILNEIPNINSPFLEEYKAQIPICIEKAKRELEYVEKNNIQIHFFTDKTFPKRLLECPDCPKLIYSKGVADFNKHKYLGVVGTRKATEYGRNTCFKLISELAKSQPKLCIISGLAYGIDIASHKAALESNIPTIGVIGGGYDYFYPKAHYNTSLEMQKRGAVITEFTHDTHPEGFNFVQRNRIIAGMSDGVLVVESAAKGGSLITAELAYSYNKDVMAVPGKICDSVSMGCNSLIKSNKAALVENAKDIERVMCWENSSHQSIELFHILSEKESIVVEIIKEKGTAHVDIISELSGIKISVLSAILLNLEFKNVIGSIPGSRYMIY